MQQHAAGDDDQPAPQDAARLFARQLGGDADDEEKEREDQVGRRPAMPLGMLQRPVDRRPRTGLLTSSIAATVRPRNASRAAMRLAVDGWRLAGTALL
jgi:hypothetical protein